MAKATTSTTKPGGIGNMVVLDNPCWKGKNIHERLLAIQAELAPVRQDLDVGTGRSSFKATGHRQVTGLVRPLLNKWNISHNIRYEETHQGAPVTQIYDSSKTVSNNSKETRSEDITLTKITCLSTVVCRCVFTCADNPESHVAVSAFGEGKDSGDKAIGKAQTYAKKYVFLDQFLMDYMSDVEDNETARDGNPEDDDGDF